MYLRWKKRHRAYERGLRWDGHAGVYRDTAMQVTAVLVTCSRVNGKPRQQYIATLGSIDAIWLTRPDRAEKRWDREAVDRRIQFWRGVRRTLAHLLEQGTITLEQSDTLQAQIAEVVPLLTKEDLAHTGSWMRDLYAMTPEQDAAMVQQLVASVGGRL